MEDRLESLFEQHMADDSLKGEEAQKLVYELIMKDTENLPEGFDMSDLKYFLESVELSDEYSKDSFVQYYNECMRTLNDTVIPEPEEPLDEEDIFSLTPDFIAERLSDLQPIEPGKLEFTFTSFIVHEAEINKIDELSKFRSLTNISLQQNSIVDARPLHGFDRLINLDLSMNKITSFSNIFIPSLLDLNLSQNSFCSLGLLNLPRLKKLDLSKNRISFMSPKALDFLCNLEYLDISGNRLKQTRVGMFKPLSKLKHLNISDNGITELHEGIFEGLANLETLIAAENMIDSIEGVASLLSLQKLDLSQTSLMHNDDLQSLIELKSLVSVNFEGAPVGNQATYRLDLILMAPWITEIDGEEITFSERKEALELDEERKAQATAEESHHEEDANTEEEASRDDVTTDSYEN